MTDDDRDRWLDYEWRAIWSFFGGQDVIAGVDHVIANHPIDRSRVATMGHSYGGFMTNWLITQYPDKFAAAITGAGITNWISDYGTADIYRTVDALRANGVELLAMREAIEDASGRAVADLEEQMVFAALVADVSLAVHEEFAELPERFSRENRANVLPFLPGLRASALRTIDRHERQSMAIGRHQAHRRRAQDEQRAIEEEPRVFARNGKLRFCHHLADRGMRQNCARRTTRLAVRRSAPPPLAPPRPAPGP